MPNAGYRVGMFADDLRDIDPSQPLSIEDALLLATRCHRLGALDDAHALYQAVLENAPEQPDALQFLGVLEHQRKRDDLALAYVQRALAQLPDSPGVHHNHGNILLELGRFDAAVSAYERCAELGGKSAELLHNLAVLRRATGEYGLAEAAYREALELDPNCIDARNGYGHLLAQQERHQEALQQFSEALVRGPTNHVARSRLGLAYYLLGRFEEAAQVYRDWLAAEPNHPHAQHYLAACTGKDVPARASDAYVASEFDDFAQSFDAKLQALNYRAPALIGAKLASLLGAPRAEHHILDAGCGTGLCQPLLAPFARTLWGVDLSLGMLQQADRRGGYHKLFKAELTAFIHAHPQTFDAIVSADTLCYFGALEAVAQVSHAALRPNGWLLFTVEALPSEMTAPFALRPHGRYGHTGDYVLRTLQQAGFHDVTLEPAVLRNEAAAPVRGFVVAAQR